MVSEETVYRFWITRQQVKLDGLPIELDSLSGQIQRLRRCLSDYEFIRDHEAEAFVTYKETAHWFYQKLLQSALEANPDIKNLLIVPDGELGHLPFETFLRTLPESATLDYTQLDYLLRHYSIGYTYSAMLWKENRESPRRKNNGKLLAMAASYPSLNELPVSDSLLTRANRSPLVRNLRNSLTELPSATQEVERLSQFFQGDFLLNKATNERFFKEKSADYGVLHLAMHGILNKKSPLLSSLAFTENGDTTEDNFLEAWEISRLQLNADLVVLSACETGYGKFQQGEGLLSLARSFMYAGVPSMVVSLWEVNDASTAQIMETFYKQLANGKDKTTALRDAKLDYLSKSRGLSAHPAFWSPFVHLGDHAPLHLQEKSNAWLWWLLGGVSVAGLAVLLLRRTKGGDV